MKFLIDENETPDVVPSLRTAFGGHEFSCAADEGLLSVADVNLFEVIAERGYHAILTQDRKQLAKTSERSMLRLAGLHWIGHRIPKALGPLMVATTIATYVSALPHVLDAITKGIPPTAFLVRNIEHDQSQRLKMSPL